MNNNAIYWFGYLHGICSPKRQKNYLLLETFSPFSPLDIIFAIVLMCPKSTFKRKEKLLRRDG